MREFLALIVSVIVVMIVYSIFFADRGGRTEAPVAGAPLAATALPVEPVLAVGDTASVVTGGSRIRYGVSLVTDSRCPRDAECVAPGEGVVVAWIEPAEGERRTVRLSTADGTPAAAGPLSFTLLDLSPYPEAGRTVGRNEFRATMRVARAN